MLLILGGLRTADAASGDQHRYVAANKIQGTLVTEYVLWRDGQSFETCVQSTHRSRDQQIACEEAVPGLPKPKIGVLRAGDEVELLDRFTRMRQTILRSSLNRSAQDRDRLCRNECTFKF
jgi:hypothetical protein